MGQTRQSSMTVIDIERSYENQLQESIDTIIDIFGKRKIVNLFFLKQLNLIRISACVNYFVILC